MEFFTWNDLRTGLGFLRALPGFLDRPVDHKEAHATLAERLRNRERDFLRLVARTVFADSRSPYRALMDNAGCTYEDLKRSVQKNGLEATLHKLFREGVYLKVQEFKGRAPVRRGSLVLEVRPSLLRNPLAPQHLRAETSGSGGRSVPVLINLAYLRDRAVNHLLALEARGGKGWTHGVWGIPGNTDMARVLELCGLGAPPDRWFSQVDPRSRDLHPRYRWSLNLLCGAARFLGVRIPKPEHAPLDRPAAVLDWLSENLRRKRVPHLVTWAGPALRLCSAARKAGLDLSGAQFSIGGEPVTRAKLGAIRRTGAQVVPRFMAMECGYIGYGCLRATKEDDYHLLSDLLATIQTGQRTGGPDRELPPGSLLISSLRPNAPFILLNVSLGDQARAIPGSCSCPLEKLGWSRRIRNVRSFERLTSDGMTFLDADILRILEEVLPDRFGGTMLDYQLVESEGPEGEARLTLRVHPDLGPLDPLAVRETFLRGLGEGSGAQRVMSLQWRSSGILAVERKAPAQARSGKIIPLVKTGRRPDLSLSR